ncbi:MAG: RNA-binding protein, partial [Planctomycetota bacterium]
MPKRLYVGNLSWDTTEDSLRFAFEQDGRNVSEVNIISDRETGRPRGFAFVEMGNDQDGEAAISALDGIELDGRNIRVNEAQERQ